jgi:hypothetical protein
MRPSEVRQDNCLTFFNAGPPTIFAHVTSPPSMAVKIKDISMTEKASELQTINTAWQIAIQEILRMVVRDIYRTGDEIVFKSHIKRIEEAAVDSIYTGLMLRGTDEWTELLVKEKASNFVTTLLTSFTFDQV